MKIVPRRRHRTSRILVATASVVFLITPTISSAGVGSTCTFDEPSGLVTIDVAADDLVTLARAGNAITLDGAACQAATVTNTDLVEVSANAMTATEIVVIDLSGGPLAPGSTDEGDGSSEIEIDVDLKDMVLDEIRIVGTPGEDSIAAGSHVLDVATLNLNADEVGYDSDVTVSGFSVSLHIHGHGGSDQLAIAGQEGFSLFGLEVIHGGPGADVLVGVLEAEVSELVGGTGRDTADYSMPPEGFDGSAFLMWEEDGAEIGPDPGSEDLLTSIEVALLGSEGDSVVYIGSATGETYGGGGHDSFAAGGGPGAGESGTRIIHGGPGGDQFFMSTDQRLVVDLDKHTIRGGWYASYSSLFAITAGDGADRVIARRRAGYPWVLTEGGVDVLDLRLASQRMFVTSLDAEPPDDGRRWLQTSAERILGSGYSDILHGDANPNELYGFAGNDVLWGRGGDDFLAGGPGNDELRGGTGEDTCLGGSGQDDVIGCAP